MEKLTEIQKGGKSLMYAVEANKLIRAINAILSLEVVGDVAGSFTFAEGKSLLTLTGDFGSDLEAGNYIRIADDTISGAGVVTANAGGGDANILQSIDYDADANIFTVTANTLKATLPLKLTLVEGVITISLDGYSETQLQVPTPEGWYQGYFLVKDGAVTVANDDTKKQAVTITEGNPTLTNIKACPGA